MVELQPGRVAKAARVKGVARPHGSRSCCVAQCNNGPLSSGPGTVLTEAPCSLQASDDMAPSAALMFMQRTRRGRLLEHSDSDVAKTYRL